MGIILMIVIMQMSDPSSYFLPSNDGSYEAGSLANKSNPAGFEGSDAEP